MNQLGQGVLASIDWTDEPKTDPLHPVRPAEEHSKECACDACTELSIRKTLPMITLDEDFMECEQINDDEESNPPHPEDCMCDDCADAHFLRQALEETTDETDLFENAQYHFDFEMGSDNDPEDKIEYLNSILRNRDRDLVSPWLEQRIHREIRCLQFELGKIFTAEKRTLDQHAAECNRTRRQCAHRKNRQASHEAHKETRQRMLQCEGKLPTPPGTHLESDSRFNPLGTDGKRYHRLSERYNHREAKAPQYINTR